jgi:hypothetical protein
MTEEFQCNCISCGKVPKQEEGTVKLWIRSSKGMVCEDCVREAVEILATSCVTQEERIEAEGEFCCFCGLCGGSPADPAIDVWVETGSGCLCSACMTKVVEGGMEEEIEKMLEG